MSRELLAVALAVALLASCGGATASTTPPPQDARRAVPQAVQGFRSVRGYVDALPPTRVQIPAIGVTSELQHLGRNPDGTVAVPEWDRAGWFAEGTAPGEPGPALILGHVDSRSGPAVFYRLRELRAGDEVLVEQPDGRVLRFLVQRLERHPKARFPTEAVFLPTLERELRLVTCDGAFDRRTGHYVDNLIVFATLAG